MPTLNCTLYYGRACVCVCIRASPKETKRDAEQKKKTTNTHPSVNNNNTEYFAHRIHTMQQQQHRNSVALHCNEHAGNDARCECIANGVWHMMSTGPSIRCVVIFAFSFYAVYIHICARDMAFAIHTALEWVKTNLKKIWHSALPETKNCLIRNNRIADSKKCFLPKNWGFPVAFLSKGVSKIDGPHEILNKRFFDKKLIFLAKGAFSQINGASSSPNWFTIFSLESDPA